MHMHMQGCDLALFQQGAADQPSILFKHLAPKSRQEEYRCIQNQTQGQKESEETEASADQSCTLASGSDCRAKKDGDTKDSRSKEEEPPRRATCAATSTEDGRIQEEEQPQRTTKDARGVPDLQRSETQGWHKKRSPCLLAAEAQDRAFSRRQYSACDLSHSTNTWPTRLLNALLKMTGQ